MKLYFQRKLKTIKKTGIILPLSFFMMLGSSVSLLTQAMFAANETIPDTQPLISEAICKPNDAITNQKNMLFDSNQKFFSTLTVEALRIKFPNVAVSNWNTNLLNAFVHLQEQTTTGKDQTLQLIQNLKESKRIEDQEKQKVIQQEQNAKQSEQPLLNETVTQIETPQKKTIAVPKITYPTIEFHDNVSNDTLISLQNEWSKLPEYIRNLYIEKEWKIVLSNENLCNFLDCGSTICGYIVYKDHVIYIHSDETDSLQHEMGHFLAYMTNTALDCYQESFVTKAYNIESKYSVVRDYARTDAVEYFADCYSWYVTGFPIFESSPRSMQEYLPQTYQMFQYIETNLNLLLNNSPYYLASLHTVKTSPETEVFEADQYGFDYNDIDNIEIMENNASFTYYNKSKESRWKIIVHNEGSGILCVNLKNGEKFYILVISHAS